MTFSIVLDNFTSLEEPWRALLENGTVNHIFLTPQWQMAWWQVFGNHHQPLLLSIRDGSELMGIAPLMRQGESISFIGNSDVCDYMDFIASRGQEGLISSALLDYLEPLEWKSISLESLLPDSLALRSFAPLAQQRGYRVQVMPQDVSPQLLLPSSWEDYLARMKAKDRHELRRKLRRLDQIKATSYHTITDKMQLHPALENFFKLFGMSEPTKASFMTGQKKKFFEVMATSLAEKGYFRLSFLEVGGSPAASCLCFDYQDDIYLYNSAYDPAYAPLSVSLLLKAFCIKDAISRRKKRFDFLRGNEAYKYDLAGQDVNVYRCVISRN